jgi:hypothetical protein
MSVYMYVKDELYRISFDPDFRPAPQETGRGRRKAVPDFFENETIFAEGVER